MGKRPLDVREVSLPGDIGTVTLPAQYELQMEEDDTLLVKTDSEDVTFRISSISFRGKSESDGALDDESDSSAEAAATDGSQTERGDAAEEADGKWVTLYEEFDEEQGVPVVVKYWEVGLHNTIVVLSATITKSQQRRPDVRETLRAIPAIIQSLYVKQAHRIVVSGDEDAGTQVEAVTIPLPELAAFGETEELWLNDNLELAGQLSQKYGSSSELDEFELDRIVARWATEKTATESLSTITDALGAALGSHLVSAYVFQWYVASDELGTDYAVVHDLSNTILIPRPAIAGRMEDGALEFFAELVAGIRDLLDRLPDTSP